MDVVVDTNIFLDAFFENDTECKSLLKKENKREFQLLMNHATSEELFRMIHSAIKRLELDRSSVVQINNMLYRALLRTKEINSATKFIKCEDKDDNMFFECAIDGNADCIVSRDHHIHDLKDIGIRNNNGKLIEILYPDEFNSKLDIIKLSKHFSSANIFKK